MFIGLSTSLFSPATASVYTGGAASPILNALGARAGFAIDFVRGEMKINDPGNPANNYQGNPESKLTVFGNDPYLYDPVKGIALDAARDFSIALATNLFPYDPNACSVFVTYQLNAATSAEQRYIFMADNAGDDRFALYATSGAAFRFVTGDGAAADIALSSRTPVAGQTERVFVGADQFGKTFVDEGGVQNDTPDTLAAAIPTHVGIGGYNNQVLRVLDGHISEIMVVCEDVPVSERLTLDLSGWGPPAGNAPQPAAFDILGARNGFAIDFIARRMKINDDVTPANAFDGDPESKLVVFGNDPYLYDPVKGLSIDAARDFSIALPTSDIPFDPNACTVHAKYRLNSAGSSEHRYLYMTDNAGSDRFALYAVNGGTMRFVTGDGAAPDISLSSMVLAADTEYRVTFGCDADGKTYVDDAGIQDNSTMTLATSTPAMVGIGGYNDRVLRVLDGHLAEIVVVYEPLIRDARLTVDAFAPVYKAEGDSHTFNTSFGLTPQEFYPSLVANRPGAGYVAVNYGWSGDSSAEMVNQVPAFTSDTRPDIATIYAGANDGPVNILASPAPTTSVVTVDASARLAVDGWVTINGHSAQITGKAGDEITISPPMPAAPAANDEVLVDTQRNIEAWIDAMQARGVPKIMVIGYHYMNWASGGDTLTTEHPTRAALRALQAAAAASRSVPFCDTLAHMRAAVAAGDVVAGDDLSWHVAVGNTHLNAAGEQAVANAVHDAFVAQGWAT